MLSRLTASISNKNVLHQVVAHKLHSTVASLSSCMKDSSKAQQHLVDMNKESVFGGRKVSSRMEGSPNFNDEFAEVASKGGFSQAEESVFGGRKVSSWMGGGANFKDEFAEVASKSGFSQAEISVVSCGSTQRMHAVMDEYRHRDAANSGHSRFVYDEELEW